MLGMQFMIPEEPTAKPRRRLKMRQWIIFTILAFIGWRGWRLYDFRSAVAEAKTLRWGQLAGDPFAVIFDDWRAAFRAKTWRDDGLFVSIPTGDELLRHRKLLHRLAPTDLEIRDGEELYDLSSIDSLSGTKRIWIDRCVNVENLDAVKGSTSLQTMALGGCIKLTSIKGIKVFPNLRSLYLRGGISLKNLDGVNPVRMLRGLDLSGCSGLENVDDLAALVALENLNLSDCVRVTNLDALSGLSNLKVLDVSGCSGLSKEAIAKLKAALPGANVQSDR